MKIVSQNDLEDQDVQSVIIEESEKQYPKKISFFKKYLFILLPLIITLKIIFCLGIYFLLFKLNKNSLVQELFIPQPFVEDNDISQFTLNNGLKVVLIKPNENYQNTFISLSVGVGTQLDPPDFTGFTHLIEHLLFTGSKNYPEDNYIEKICNKYQGQNNGVTKSFNTSYYYSIDGEGFEEFSKVLVDAIVNPLFKVENIEKEINNVNSEISMRMTFNKSLGVYKLLKKFGNSESKLFQDGFSNIDLNDVNIELLQKEIIGFHKKYYSANIMTLVVISDEKKSDIEQMIKNEFIKIPNKNIQRPLFKNEIKPISKSMKGEIYYLQGYEKNSQFSLVFELESFKNQVFQPLDFFSTYFNYDHKQSFKSELIKQGLILDYGDEIILSDFNNTIYKITFQVTKKGEQKISKIINHFFNFIDKLKSLQNKGQFFQQLSQITKYNFLFNSDSQQISVGSLNQNPFDRVVDFSEALLDFKGQDLFTQGKIMAQYDEKTFQKVLDQLQPKNAVYIYENQKFEKSKIILKDPKLESLPRRKLGKAIRQLKLLGRKLDLVNPRIIQKFKNKFLNKCRKYFHLIFEFDFDENRRYFHQKLPSLLLKDLQKQIKLDYKIINDINIDYISSYDMITQCQIPQSLQKNNKKSVSIDKMFDLIFLQKNNKHIINDLTDLTEYKLCMIKEFQDDDDLEKPIILTQNRNFSVHYKIFRKQLESKYMTIIELESPFLLNNFINKEEQQLTQSSIQLDLVCLYLISHMQLVYNQEFVKGYQFDCNVTNFVIVLQFLGIKRDLFKFQKLILNNIVSLKDSRLFNENIIENLKKKIFNKYSDFDQTTSLDLSMYYFKRILDKLFIDYSDEQKLNSIIQIIQKTNQSDLSLLISQILESNKQTFLYVGNISKKESIYQSNQLNQILSLKSHFILNEIDYRKKITEKMLLQLNDNQHLLTRTVNKNLSETNNVYLTYFKMGILNKKQKVLGLTLENIASNLVFDELRNKLNLGYVAHAGLKVFYHNLGLIILLQGENFRPNQIEKNVEIVLQKIIEEIKKKSEQEIKDMVLQNVSDILQLPDSLEEVGTKLFYHLQEEKLNNDHSSYIDILKEFEKKDLLNFVQKYLIDKPQRITLELFANKITQEEQNFELPTIYSLNSKTYNNIPFDLLSEMKFIVN